MKKMLIRTGVFETNSSSCHSVSVADETKPFIFDTIYPDLDGKITVKGGQYIGLITTNLPLNAGISFENLAGQNHLSVSLYVHLDKLFNKKKIN